MPSRRLAPLLVACTLALTALGAAYLVNGVKTLTATDFGGDLLLRWREQRYVANRINPYDISARSIGLPLTESEAARLERRGVVSFDPINSIGYPPWGFFWGMLLVYPGNFRATQVIFAAVNVAALAWVTSWAYRAGRSRGPLVAAFLGASVFAVFGNASTLRLGQYGIICNAMLVLMMWAEERERPVSAGLAFAIAAVKPTIAALFVTIFLVRRRFRETMAASLCLLAASLIVGYLVETSPLEMVKQILAQSSRIATGGVGPINVLADYGVPYGWASAACGGVGALAALFLMWRYRAAPTLTLCAIAAVIGRLVVYHRQYDNVMLVFPLVALGLHMFERPTASRIAIFVVFAGSLWVPFRYRDYSHPVVLALTAIWLVGLWAILAFSPRRAPVV